MRQLGICGEFPQIRKVGIDRLIGGQKGHWIRLSRNGFYLSLKLAARFSAKAAMPSFWSSSANMEWNTRRSKRRPSVSVVS
ncbi:hypothetical protein QFZ34_003162 [Phyllobacterium ifriqiyense]|uniref:Uncharacterized protein n=1 Tax=Phyllobacterium ifriqiyense TaxID=314238 RepID=A0ABU0SB88_9HYPH|nr:hypothetical protein [Phyllobacterium ifriqiyense]